VAALSLSACKIKITVPPGGEVISSSGNYNCLEDKVCVIDVYDIFFSETFTARPKPGFEFSKWAKGKKTFCANSEKPCALSTDGLDAFPDIMAVVESDDIFHLKPIFNSVASNILMCESSVDGGFFGIDQGDTFSLDNGALLGLESTERLSTQGAVILIYRPGDKNNASLFRISKYFSNQSSFYDVVVLEEPSSCSTVAPSTVTHAFGNSLRIDGLTYEKGEGCSGIDEGDKVVFPAGQDSCLFSETIFEVGVNQICELECS
jgi:hypothetical protein